MVDVIQKITDQFEPKDNKEEENKTSTEIDDTDSKKDTKLLFFTEQDQQVS